jgi:D-amino-acid oxidase
MALVTVIGCGVSGLSCAIRLQEAGHRARIVARELPPHTTSNVAAAVWYPYRAYPQELVNRWARESYNVFAELARLPESGVVMSAGLEIFEYTVGDPEWRAALPGFRRPDSGELPPGYVDGYAYEVPVIEMPVYLRYLRERFAAGGGEVRQAALASVSEAFADADAVVNTSGLGARELVGDRELFPIRGQVLRVAPVPGLRRFVLDDHGHRGLAYIVPRGDGVVLGGTADDGAEDAAVDPHTAAAIRERCEALEPALRGAQALEHKVGLRPGRPSVRLQTERDDDGRPLIHNYGHGGAGVTLSWGCARAVVALLNASGLAGEAGSPPTPA